MFVFWWLSSVIFDARATLFKQKDRTISYDTVRFVAADPCLLACAGWQGHAPTAHAPAHLGETHQPGQAIPVGVADRVEGLLHGRDRQAVL